MKNLNIRSLAVGFVIGGVSTLIALCVVAVTMSNNATKTASAQTAGEPTTVATPEPTPAPKVVPTVAPATGTTITGGPGVNSDPFDLAAGNYKVDLANGANTCFLSLYDAKTGSSVSGQDIPNTASTAPVTTRLYGMKAGSYYVHSIGCNGGGYSVTFTKS